MKLAIFDVDGTLVDSRRTIQHCMVRAFESLDLPPPSYEVTRQIVGLNLAGAFQVLAPDMGQGDRERLRKGYTDAYVALHETPGAHEPLYEGAAALLDHLRAEGWVLSMATGKSRRGVDRVMATHSWADYFTSTHCADDGPGKPDPAMVLASLAACGMRPGQAVMIGDTTHDIGMAKAADVRALGVTWGFHTLEEVRSAGPDHISHTFDELRTELDRFAKA